MSGHTEQQPAMTRTATASVPEQTRPSDVPEPPPTGAGTVLAGRYRLRDKVGSEPAAGAEFWLAEDTVLRRDVAVTVLRRLAADPESDDPDGTARADEMIVRALRAGSFEHRGCARLLDVLAPGGAALPPDVLGAAVSEWVAGRSLAETVAAGLIRPRTVARMVEPLAAAVAEAHRHGLVLGCDHPQRIRVGADGQVQMAFVLARAGVTPADDVRGLGAVLYTLLTGRWPLSGADAARSGLQAADKVDERPVAPSAVRPGVPVELDAVALGALGPDDDPSRVRTSAAVQRMLADVVAEDDRHALFPPVHDGVPPGPGDVWQDQARVSARADPRRRRKLMVGLSVLAVGMLIVFGYLGVVLGSMFGDSSGGPRIVVGSSVPPSGPAPDPAVGTSSVAPAGIEVYDGSGDADNAGRISRVIDGNPSTSWRTYVYKQQFPALKRGVGMMTSFASAVQLSSIAIDSPSDGTVVEIRSAPSADSEFAETVLISRATLGSGVTQVSLSQSQPVQHLLIWITRLGGGGGDENVTEINEITFQRAGD